MFTPAPFRSIVFTLALASLCTPLLAQPTDRPAALQAAIAAATSQAPGWPFYEASLENDGGQWLFEIHVVAANGSSMIEYEVDPASFAVLRSRPKSLSSSKIAQIQSTLAQLGSASVTTAQAITVAAGRTPDGTLMQHVEIGIELTHLSYKFEFVGAAGTQRLVVDATTGQPLGGNPGTPPPTGGDATLDQAIQSALALYPGAKILESEFEAADGRWEIRLVTAQGQVRKVRIGVSGQLISDDEHRRGREDAADDRLRTLAMQSAPVTLAQAKSIAEAAAPGAVAIKAEWEFEHGVLLAKVGVQDSVGTRVVFVNATHGGIVTPTTDPAPTPPTAPAIDIATAASTGAAANSGSAAISAEMEIKGGRAFYKVKTLTRTAPLRLREVVVDGKTGAVWSNTLMPMASAYLPTAQRIVGLLPGAARSFADARTVALASLGDGVVQSIELESEQNSYLVYTVDVIVGQKTFRLQVDSRTGSVRPK